MLRENNPLLEPTEVVIKFEKAAIVDFKSTTSLKGCFFYFEQVNWQKYELKPAVEYRKDKE